MKILDGAMGTMLQESGNLTDGLPEELNITNTQTIINIHKKYILAGADIIYANTFGANRYKISETKYSVSELVKAGIANAKKAAEGSETKIALDIGPLGQMLEPIGTMKFEEAIELFKEIIIAGKDADIIAFETFTDLYELKAGVLAAKENSSQPIFTTMSFEKDARTFSGTTLETFSQTMEGLGVDALGINCSLGPKEILPFINTLSAVTTVPLIAKPNAGLPDSNGNFSLSAENFAKELQEITACEQVQYIGGCCGTTPYYIDALSFLKNKNEVGFIYNADNEDIKTADCELNIAYKNANNLVDCNSNNYKLSENIARKNADADDFQLTIDNCQLSITCSATKFVNLKEPQIVGERLNPTGKKRFREALQNEEYDYILTQAIEQIDAGATILDVNVGVPNIDEVKVMTTLVKKIQAVVDVPLMIDSKSPAVIEAALRVYNGKAIVNSTTCEKAELEAIIPHIKKYGANIIVLTIDENGIPETAEQRINMAEKTAKYIVSQGVPKKNILFDCLTMSVATESRQVKETLNALKTLTNLGYSTVLGVSNISFGLPDREKINSNFLAMALYHGLKLPIMNPLSNIMTDTFYSTNVLSGTDKNADKFISSRPQQVDITNTVKVDNPTNDINYYIKKGLQTETAKLVTVLLQNTDPLAIINEHLIPALDKVGAEFETGKIFLPQLIMSAQSAQSAFKEIEKYYAKKGVVKEKKGCIILATVKGDVHDIGKNIVKTLLESYGFKVVDLGKDVLPTTIYEAAIKHKADIVGLSALMTTTLKSMEETISLLKKTDCKIMVGGAVLTLDYALSIGADFYAKNAKAGVDFAKLVVDAPRHS
ncbi:5-methyltetrahydrofolate--homocysteine methyltransferase [Clostridia bacterium]|nr:5-methyltetrahydrofolate--homocysteine methyltransferase [Clostridia bacterium]